MNYGVPNLVDVHQGGDHRPQTLDPTLAVGCCLCCGSHRSCQGLQSCVARRAPGSGPSALQSIRILDHREFGG